MLAGEYAAEDEAEHEALLRAVQDPAVDLVKFERERIKGAIRTDFILSAEIIVISLGVVRDAELMVRIGTVAAIAALMTLGVYGLVAAIVKLDDLGLHMVETAGASRRGKVRRSTGEMILRIAPKLMKSLTILGTAAMFLVGGGILVHGIPLLESLLHHIEDPLKAIEGVGGLLAVLAGLVFNAVVGIFAGGILVGFESLVAAVRTRVSSGSA